MSKWSLALLAGRVAVTLALLVALSPLGGGQAVADDAKKAAEAAKAAEPTKSGKKVGDTPYSEEQVKARAEARERAEKEAAEAPSVPSLPPPPPVAVKKKVVVQEVTIPGCAQGTLCTVCVAGCRAGENRIVQVKPDRSANRQ